MKELELSKKLAVLGKLFQMKLINESEYTAAKNKIMLSYNVVSFVNI